MTAAIAPTVLLVPESYSLPDAAKASGISERFLFDAITKGDLVAHTLTGARGSKKVILRGDLVDFLAGLPVWEPPR